MDYSGSAYVTAEAGSSFPLFNPFQQYGGTKDAFVSKFSPDGATLIYSTYIGGSYLDSADSIATDIKVATRVPMSIVIPLTNKTESADMLQMTAGLERYSGG